MAVIFSPGCRLHCLFCRAPSPSEIERSDVLQQLEDVYRNVDYHYDNGIKLIEISGCDPADGKFSDLLSIINYIKNKDKNFDILLSTNGATLVEEEKIKLLVESGLASIRIPIYGSKPEAHEPIVGGFIGSLEHSKTCVKLFMKHGANIHFQILVTKINKDDIINTLDMCIQMAEKYSPSGIDSIGNISISIPCIPDPITEHKIKDLEYYYIPNRELLPVITPIYSYIKQLNFDRIIITEIPYCLVGEDSDIVFNNNTVEKLSSLIGRQKPHASLSSKENPHVPNYRIHEHVEFCRNCSVSYKCSGFFKNDLRIYGIEEKNVKLI